MPDGSEKTCVLYGESCAGQLRIKDARGRYYHRRCHEQALRRRQQREQDKRQASDAFAEAEPPPIVGGDDDADVMSMLLDDSAPTAPPVAAASSTCPSCGSSVAPGAVLCVNCGFNLQSGQAVQTAVASGSPVTGSGSNTKWPIVIGVISIVLAVLSLAASGFAILNAMLISQPRLAVREVIPTAFALWLFAGGIGVLRRRQAGFRRLQTWSIWKTIVTVICGGALVVATIVSQDTIEDMLPPDMQGLGILLVLAVVIGLVWELWWALFCLMWTHRNKIQSEVSEWA